jgi:hypothetical protein
MINVWYLHVSFGVFHVWVNIDFIFLIKNSSFMIYPLDLESVSNQRPMLMQLGSTLELHQFLRLFVSSLGCFNFWVNLCINFLVYFVFGALISSHIELHWWIVSPFSHTRHMEIHHSKIVNEHLKKQWLQL